MSPCFFWGREWPFARISGAEPDLPIGRKQAEEHPSAREACPHSSEPRTSECAITVLGERVGAATRCDASPVERRGGRVPPHRGGA